MAFLQDFQVWSNASRQMRSAWTLSMFFRVVLRRPKTHCLSTPLEPAILLPIQPTVICRQPIVSRGSTPFAAISTVLAISVILSFGRVDEMLAAAIDKYLGVPPAKVEFISDDVIDESALRSAVLVAVGKPLEALDVRQSISKLYQTREFAQIEVDASLEDAGLVITFKLRPNFFFANFRLRGDPMLRSPLSSLVPLPIGEAYSPKTVEQFQQK